MAPKHGPKDEVLGLRSSQVWRLLGVAPSTLNYWVQIGLVKPTLRGPQGKRVEYYWSVQDVVAVQAVRALRQAGASLKQVKRVRTIIAAHGGSLSNTRLYWDGRDIHLQDEDGLISSALQRPGQMVLLGILPLGVWQDRAARDAQPVSLSDLRSEARRRRKAQAGRREPTQPVVKLVEDGKGGGGVRSLP